MNEVMENSIEVLVQISRYVTFSLRPPTFGISLNTPYSKEENTPFAKFAKIRPYQYVLPNT